MKGYSLSILFLCCGWLLLPYKAIAQVIPAPTIGCVTTDESSGDVTIIWTNPPLNPCGPFVSYTLMGGTSPTGPFQTVATITNAVDTMYIHTGANGTILDWYYYITMVQNCPGSTQSYSDTVKEETLFIPRLNYVTVTPAGVEIHWFPSQSLQTAGYYIIRKLGGILEQTIDSVYGINTTMYLDTFSNPDSASITYTIAAFNVCVPRSRSASADSAQNTIFLTAAVASCEQEITLSWNQYVNWNPGVGNYLLETALDGAPFTTSETLPDGSTGFLYELAGVTGDTLCFRVTAVHENGSPASQSNIRCVPLDLVRSTTFNHLRRVSVNAAGDVEVDWYIDTFADINSYYVRRSTDGSSFENIDTLAVTNPQLLNSYIDTQALTDERTYFYQSASFDDCNFQLNSATGQTIFLEGENNAILNELEWNAFSLQNATVIDYTIYRVENGVLVPLQAVPPTTLTFQDDISTAISENGAFCYVIEANYILDIPGLVNETLTSTSNQFCLYQTPVVYVPNAFVPEGKNNYFKPTLLNPNVAEYEFLIFDRWGKELFSTDVLAAGWDGTNNGEAMPMGGYSYYIKVVSLGGEVQEKTGMVVLVR